MWFFSEFKLKTYDSSIHLNRVQNYQKGPMKVLGKGWPPYSKDIYAYGGKTP